jgi:hypothetical protein
MADAEPGRDIDLSGIGGASAALARSRRREVYEMTTDALILHCPGPLRHTARPIGKQWDRAQRTFFSDPATAGSGGDVDGLTVITYNSRPHKSLLERCIERLGLTELVVLGRGLPDWKLDYKVTLLRDFLAGDGAAEHVLCLDADDVLMLEGPRAIFERYHHAGGGLLFSSTAWNWPWSQACWDFENEVGADADPAHRHLNSGGFIGHSDEVRRYLAEIDEARRSHAPWCSAREGFDDQLAWRGLHRRHHPAIRVDMHCSIFVRFDEHR